MNTNNNPLLCLQKVGEAKLKVLFWEVYYSSLYNATGEYHAEQFPQVLKIDYLRNVSAKDLIKVTKDEWHKLAISKALIDQWLPMLSDIFPNIKKGDTLIVRVNENKHSEFFFNGKALAEITDSAFGVSFLRIWLDEKCSYPSVRNKLIGLQA